MKTVVRWMKISAALTGYGVIAGAMLICLPLAAIAVRCLLPLSVAAAVAVLLFSPKTRSWLERLGQPRPESVRS